MARMGKRNKAEKYAEAIKLLNEGKKMGAYPSARTGETVISYASTIEEAMGLVTAFGKRGVEPTQKMLGVTLNIAKEKKQALSIIREFDIFGVKVDTYALNRLVSLCESEKEAVPIMNYYNSEGVKPTPATIAALIKVSSSIQYADTVIKKSFDKKIVEPNNYVLNARLTLCETLDEMNYITEEMNRAYGLKADAISSSIKIRKALDEKDFDFAQAELEKAKTFANNSSKTNTILKRYENTLLKERRKQEAAQKPSPEDFTGDGIFDVDMPVENNAAETVAEKNPKDKAEQKQEEPEDMFA